MRRMLGDRHVRTISLMLALFDFRCDSRSPLDGSRYLTAKLLIGFETLRPLIGDAYPGPSPIDINRDELAQLPERIQ